MATLALYAAASTLASVPRLHVSVSWSEVRGSLGRVVYGRLRLLSLGTSRLAVTSLSAIRIHSAYTRTLGALADRVPPMS